MVYLKTWERSDAQALYELCKDESLRKNWYYKYLYPYTIKRAEECIDFYRNANPYRFYIQAIMQDHQVCGFIQCEVKNYGVAELSYWLASSYRKQGIMEEAVALMCEASFQALEILTIYARVDMKNIASQHVLLHNGFQESRETVPIYMYFRHKHYGAFAH